MIAAWVKICACMFWAQWPNGTETCWFGKAVEDGAVYPWPVPISDERCADVEWIGDGAVWALQVAEEKHAEELEP